jgi:hypothetical protein
MALYPGTNFAQPVQQTLFEDIHAEAFLHPHGELGQIEGIKPQILPQAGGRIKLRERRLLSRQA